MGGFLTRNLLWKQGRTIVIVHVGLCILCFFLPPFVFIPVISSFVFFLFFFRYPLRVCQAALQDPCTIISPADGRVLFVKHTHDADGSPVAHVAIFLSVFDVHVNWIPVSGTVVHMKYIPGGFACAFDAQRSSHNERHVLALRTDDGHNVTVTQIAGLLARRILVWITLHDRLKVGETFGMITLGSRVDITFPLPAKVCVVPGQRVKGGYTVLGRLHEK